MNIYCIKKTTFLIICLIIILIIFLISLNIKKICPTCPQCPICPICPSCPPCIQQKNQEQAPIIIQHTRPEIITEFDPVRQYDYGKIYDPLEQPAKRLPRYQMYPEYIKRIIDLPTRG